MPDVVSNSVRIRDELKVLALSDKINQYRLQWKQRVSGMEASRLGKTGHRAPEAKGGTRRMVA